MVIGHLIRVGDVIELQRLITSDRCNVHDKHVDSRIEDRRRIEHRVRQVITRTRTDCREISRFTSIYSEINGDDPDY